MKLCRCGAMVKQRCDKCSPKSTTNRHVYGINRWRKLSEAKREADPLCEECLKLEIAVPAEEVHHVIPIRLAPHLAFEWSNLESLCVDCHRAKDGELTHGGG
jgi:5-methylcytosine-specific restriction protein A